VQADFNYDYDQMNTLKSELESIRNKCTKLGNTFGNTHDKYHKQVIASEAAYLSRVNECDSMIGIKELQAADRHLLSLSPRLPTITADRGLLSPSARLVR